MTSIKKPKAPAYKDVWIRLLLSLIAAHFIVTIGEQEDISQIISYFNYYNALIASFIIAFLLLYIIWLFTRYLDTKLDWQQKTVQRIVAQIGLGIVMPSLCAVLLAWVYFRMYGYQISETTYFSNDFPVIVLLLVVANIYYFLYYMIYHYWPAGSDQHKAGAQDAPLVTDEQMQTVAENDPKPAVEEKNQREIYIVNTPTRSIPIKAADICYCYRLSGCNFLKTFTGEAYIISDSLKDLEQQLSPELFFRINRQMIVNFNACTSFAAGDREGTLYLHLDPALEKGDDPKVRAMAMVSEDRVASFRSWIKR